MCGAYSKSDRFGGCRRQEPQLSLSGLAARLVLPERWGARSWAVDRPSRGVKGVAASPGVVKLVASWEIDVLMVAEFGECRKAEANVIWRLTGEGPPRASAAAVIACGAFTCRSTATFEPQYTKVA